jgi:hypothetical protein
MEEFSVTDYTSGRAVAYHRFRQQWPEDRIYYQGQTLYKRLQAQPADSLQVKMSSWFQARQFVLLSDRRIQFQQLTLRGDEIRRGEIVRYGTGSPFDRIRLWVEDLRGTVHVFDFPYADAWRERDHFGLSYREALRVTRKSDAQQGDTPTRIPSARPPVDWVRVLFWVGLAALVGLLLLNVYRQGQGYSLWQNEPQEQTSPAKRPANGDIPL